MISIVTPIYNSAPHLKQCFNNVIGQTYSDFEWLLVDDHGGDNSIELINELIVSSNMGDKIKVLSTTKNSGPGEARNVGLRAAKGEYIMFIDSDDIIEPTMLNTLLNAIKASDSDMVYCQALEHNNDKCRLLSNPKFINQKQLLSKYIGRIWTCLFNTNFLRRNNLEFPPYRAAEDSSFFAACIISTNKITSIDEVLYHYIIYPQSTSHKYDNERTKQKQASFAWLINYAKQKNLWNDYKWQLRFIYLKKAIIVPLLEKWKLMK